ncbi:MAG: filamentous hemagglutinin N-terminal domain-containing protein [Schwartzia sp.]|nr:filamentous hemagglutinin N-terminal domain-containing protein [Schwartzia sp. (in: firmicutes)]
MKKYGKFFKKAALTAAVCLSLSQSVWAMPTGGEVEFGNVTGFSANPTSGATIATVSDAAIINWEAFGIASGEALSFDTTNGALLNRVTGGNLSQILGTLSQTGDNPMFLVNPAGITVGGGAVIDANTLVLSTLAMSNEQFMHAANGWMEFGDGSTPGQLTIEKGAEINVSNMLTALGGTVEVADGVTFSVDKDLVLTAANNVTASVGSTVQGDYTLGSDAFRPTGISATKENTLSVGTNTINTEDLAFLAGGKVNITGAEIGSKNVDVLSASSGQTTESDADIVYTAGTDNAITIKGATLKSSDDLDILGGVVTIDNSELSGSGIDIAAVGEYTAFANGDAANRPLGTGHTLSLTSTTVTDTDGSDIFMGGGAVTLNGATVTSPTKVFISAYNDDRNGTMEKGNALAVSSKSNIHADGAVTLLGYTTSISDSKLSGERLQLAAATSGTAKDNDSFFFTSMKMAPDNKITMTKATIEDTKIAYISGGNVALTDTTVTAANTENKDDLKIWALSGVTANGDDNISPDFSSASGASSDYAVTLKNSNVTLNTSGSKDPGISISGGKVTLDASTLALSGGDDNSINVYAANGQEDDTITATSENLIELKNGSMIDSQGERI